MENRWVVLKLDDLLSQPVHWLIGPCSECGTGVILASTRNRKGKSRMRCFQKAAAESGPASRYVIFSRENTGLGSSPVAFPAEQYEADEVLRKLISDGVDVHAELHVCSK